MEERKERKKRRNITIDLEINSICNEMNINVSRECNNFLKLLIKMEDIEEEEIIKRMAETEQEIRDKHKEITILQNRLDKMRSKRLENKKTKEDNLLWNRLVSEYRNQGDIDSKQLEIATKQLNLTEDKIYQKIERLCYAD